MPTCTYVKDNQPTITYLGRTNTRSFKITTPMKQKNKNKTTKMMLEYD